MPTITKTSEILADWEKVTTNLSKIFVKRYFGNDVSDVYFVGDVIGDVLVVNDYFFDILFICKALRGNFTKGKMFDTYDTNLENYV